MARTALRSATLPANTSRKTNSWYKLAIASMGLRFEIPPARATAFSFM